MNSPTRMDGRTGGNISFSSWKQTQISSQQTFAICLSPSLLEFRIIFGERSAQFASCPPLRRSPVSYTSHAGSSHSRQWGMCPNHTCLWYLQTCSPRNQRLLSHFHPVSQLQAAVFSRGTRRLRNRYPDGACHPNQRSKYLTYFRSPPRFGQSVTYHSMLASRCTPDFPGGCHHCHSLCLSPFIHESACWCVSHSLENRFLMKKAKCFFSQEVK